MIIKKLRNIGNSWGVIIPKAILEGLNINPVRDEVSIEDGCGRDIQSGMSRFSYTLPA